MCSLAPRAASVAFTYAWQYLINGHFDQSVHPDCGGDEVNALSFVGEAWSSPASVSCASLPASLSPLPSQPNWR